MASTPEVKDLIATAIRNQAEAEAAERELEAAKASARARLNEVRELILAGQSTGDPIRDYVILVYGDLHGDVDPIFRDLSARVAAHPGELVLVATSKESSFGCTGFGGERQVTWSSELQLGILEPNASGITIELKQSDVPESRTRWSLPTTRHLTLSDQSFRSQAIKEEVGAISPSRRYDIIGELLPRLTPDLDAEDRYVRLSERRHARFNKHFVDILIGDDEVLGARSEYHRLSEMCHELGVWSPERTLF